MLQLQSLGDSGANGFGLQELYLFIYFSIGLGCVSVHKCQTGKFLWFVNVFLMRNIGDLQPPGAIRAGSAPLGATAEAEYAPAWSNVLSLLESNHRPPGRVRR